MGRSSPNAIAAAVAGFTDVGRDELTLFPCNPDLGQVELIAGAAAL